MKKNHHTHQWFSGMVLLVWISVALACGNSAEAGQNKVKNDTTRAKTTIEDSTTLSAADVYNVTAVDVVERKGYTITSAVCEVVSSEYSPVNGKKWEIVFHAFRVTGPLLPSETILLFGSNHAAADGPGLTYPVNDDAIRLVPEFSAGATLAYPVTLDTDGASVAIECAQQAGEPVVLELDGLDAEEWRNQVIEKFGPEKVYDDGSKMDYVEMAFIICDSDNQYKDTYEEGSIQQFILDTFCTHIPQEKSENHE